MKVATLFWRQVGQIWSYRAVSVFARILIARSTNWAWFQGLFFWSKRNKLICHTFSHENRKQKITALYDQIWPTRCQNKVATFIFWWKFNFFLLFSLKEQALKPCPSCRSRWEHSGKKITALYDQIWPTWWQKKVSTQPEGYNKPTNHLANLPRHSPDPGRSWEDPQLVLRE